jgi:subtilisin family serine protease
MSLGGVREESTDGPDPCPSGVQQAVLHALRRGVLVVAASGNSGDEDSPVEEPGVCLGVVSVGAVDRNLNVASFSSRHPYLTLTAPGDNIPSLSRDSAYIGEGTSQATAITSAALALVWSRYPTESSRQILARLLTTATDRGPHGRDPAYGYGVINPAAAIAAAVPAATVANPVLDGAKPLLSGGSATGPKPLAAAGSATEPRDAVPVTGPAGWLSARAYLLGGLTLLFLLLAMLAFTGWLRRRRGRAPAQLGWPAPG